MADSIEKNIELLGKLRQELTALQAEQKKLDKTTEEGAKAFENNRLKMQELQKEIKKTTNSTQELGKTNWTKFKEGATKSFGAIGKSFNTLSKTFLTNPIGIAITAVTAAVKALWDAFKKNDAASTSLQKLGAAFKPILDVIQRGLQWVVEKLGVVAEKLSNVLPPILGKLVTTLSNVYGFIVEKGGWAASKLLSIYTTVWGGILDGLSKIGEYLGLNTEKLKDFAESVKGLDEQIEQKSKQTADVIRNTGKSIAESFEEQSKAAQDNVKKIDAYEEAKRRFTVNEAKRNKEIADLRAELADADTKDYEKRKELLDRIISIEEESQKEKVKLAKEELRQLRYKASVTKDTSDETANAIAAAEAKVIEAQSSAAEANRRFIKERKKIAEEEVKAEQEKIQKLTALIQDYTNTVFAESLEFQKSGLEKQLKEQESVLEESLQKGLITQEQYNSLKIGLAKEYSDKITEIQQKQIKSEYALRVLKAQNAGSTEEEIRNIQLESLEKQLALYNEDSKEYQELLAEKIKLTEDANKSIVESTEQTIENQNKKITDSLNALKSAVGLFSELNNTLKAQEAADLEQYKESQQAKQDALQARFDAGLISEEQYENQRLAISEETSKKEAELKNKQAKRAKALNIANATIAFSVAMVQAVQGAMAAAAATGPLAVISGPIFTAVMTALAAATAGAALATAIATPIPKAAKGGIAGGGLLQGPSHSNGGIQIEAEGGEAIINKRSTAKYASLLSLINQAEGGVAIPTKGNGIFASGGIVNQGGYSTSGIKNQKIEYPPIYVTIEDINRGQKEYVQIINDRSL